MLDLAISLRLCRSLERSCGLDSPRISQIERQLNRHIFNVICINYLSGSPYGSSEEFLLKKKKKDARNILSKQCQKWSRMPLSSPFFQGSGPIFSGISFPDPKRKHFSQVPTPLAFCFLFSKLALENVSFRYVSDTDGVCQFPPLDLSTAEATG